MKPRDEILLKLAKREIERVLIVSDTPSFNQETPYASEVLDTAISFKKGEISSEEFLRCCMNFNHQAIPD